MDAARLDVEMTAMLREQLSRVFSLSQPGLLLRYEPELNAFFRVSGVALLYLGGQANTWECSYELTVSK
jgi:hypothetical protein